MATTASQSFTELKRGLAGAIRARRADCVPGEAARHLLAYDRADHRLVGIDYEARKVVYYHDPDSQAYVCPFSDSGLECGRGGPLALLTPPVTLESWIQKIEYFWGWVHPRFEGPKR